MTDGLRSSGGSARRRVAAAGAVVAAGLAAGAAKSETLRVVPTFAVTEAYSDNVALIAGELAQSGWVTTLAPGIRADLAGARVKGFFDYRLNSTYYSSESRLNSTQSFLNSFAKVKAVDDLLFVDARAEITQLNRSAFGAAVTPGASTPSANRVQATSYLLAPYVRGHVSDSANYELRLNRASVRTDDVALPDATTTEWVGKVDSASSTAKLRWAADASDLSLRNEIAGTLKHSRIRGSLIYALDPEIHVSAIAGRETTDFTVAPRRPVDTPGVGLEWTPTVRTRLAAVGEKRFFGTGHTVIFSHRTPLTAFRIVSIEDAAVLPTQLATSSASSIQSLMSDVLASAIPDPEVRAAAIQRRLEQTGISATSALSSNFVTSRPYVFRNDVASFALLGAANTITFTVTRREQRGFGVRLASEANVEDEDFRQRGFSANFAHKLSPRTTLTFAATSLRTDDLTLTTRQSRQHLYTLLLSTQVRSRTSASFGIRRVEFDSSTPSESYRENAVFGSVSIRL